MKRAWKKWIYVLIMLAVVGGFFYIVLEKEEPKSPNTSKEETQKQETNQVSPGKTGEDTQLPAIAVGKKLPDFTLKNLDGQDVNLRQLEGKIVLLNFWATWCPHCVKEMPDLQKLQDENDDLVVVAINVDERKTMVEDYIDKGGYEFEVLLDEEGKLAKEYLVAYMPTSFFVDKDGLLYGGISGGLTYDQMAQIIGDMGDL